MEKVPFLATIYTCEKSKYADIELSLVNQQGLVNVFLNDVGSSLIFPHVAYKLCNPISEFNPFASICVFAWFDDPTDI